MLLNICGTISWGVAPGVEAPVSWNVAEVADLVLPALAALAGWEQAGVAQAGMELLQWVHRHQNQLRAF